MVKNLPAVQEMWVPSLGRQDPLEEEMETHSSILARKIHGQGCLAGYSPRGRKESDMTERARTHVQIQPTVEGWALPTPTFSHTQSRIKVRPGLPR